MLGANLLENFLFSNVTLIEKSLEEAVLNYFVHKLCQMSGISYKP